MIEIERIFNNPQETTITVLEYWQIDFGLVD